MHGNNVMREIWREVGVNFRALYTLLTGLIKIKYRRNMHIHEFGACWNPVEREHTTSQRKHHCK